ncbi:hypothetical protein TNCV_3229601 [Trichonephila clavipes]|nr:hypothetical protein TNCV_3229601 [Trichonephila clavipes]
MSITASRVEETSSEISSLALTLPKNKQSCFFDQQRFIMLAEKGIAMTMWKIVPIRRSFIFSKNPKLAIMVSNDAKMVTKVAKLAANLVVKYEANLAISPSSH